MIKLSENDNVDGLLPELASERVDEIRSYLHIEQLNLLFFQYGVVALFNTFGPSIGGQPSFSLNYVVRKE
jgi:hypothetical protein